MYGYMVGQSTLRDLQAEGTMPSSFLRIAPIAGHSSE